MQVPTCFSEILHARALGFLSDSDHSQVSHPVLKQAQKIMMRANTVAAVVFVALIVVASKAVDPEGMYLLLRSEKEKSSLNTTYFNILFSYLIIQSLADPDEAQTRPQELKVCGGSLVAAKLPKVQELRSALLQGGNHYRDLSSNTTEGMYRLY